MKFNNEDIQHVSAQWNSTIEGLLLIKQKSESIFKRSNEFTEHWCRLKGNLLIILRNGNKDCTDPIGIVLLEHCSVKSVVGADIRNVFRIDFKSGDPSLLMAARSADEANSWCSLISRASLEELSVRRDQLRVELKRMTGRDPLDPLGQLISSSDASKSDAIGLELRLSLMTKNASLPKCSKTDLKIIIYDKDSDEKELWNLVTETEIGIESNPTSLKTVKWSPTRCSDSALLKFCLLKFDADLRPSATCVVGSAQISTQTLRASSTLKLPIVNVDPLNESQEPTYFLVIQVTQCSSPPSIQWPGPDNHHFQYFCENILTRDYRFAHTLGEEMRVVEFMGESRICFQFPIEYLKSLITREHLLYDSLSRIGLSDPTMECLRKERLLGMKCVIERYESCLRCTADQTGQCFKRSTERNCSELDFVPTNLHANRIGLLDATNRLMAFYDIISAGGFSCALDQSRCKGLFQSVANERPGGGGGSSSTSLGELVVASPTVSALLQCDGHPAGRAIRLLATGALLVVRMRGDLSELHSRLQADGQASVLAQRLEKGFAAIMKISQAASPENNLMSSIQQDYDVLLRKVIEMSTLDTMERAASSTGSPSAYSDVGCDKDVMLREIQTSSNLLDKSLSRVWEGVEETLWTVLLSYLSAKPSSAEGLSQSQRLHSASNFWDKMHYQHHSALCQALTVTLTGLGLSLVRWSSEEWRRMIKCGVPLHFEGLFSCYGEELKLLENWSWAVQALAFCHVTIRPRMDISSESPNDGTAPKISNSLHVKVTSYNEFVLLISQSAWDKVPKECRIRGHFTLSLHPYHFNVGINEQQTFAERLERVGLQTSINDIGLTSLQNYFDKYTKKFGAPNKTATNQDVCDVLSSLRHIMESCKSKPVELLQLAAEISGALSAIRFSSCKSAKDRTGMSVSLEQARWLRDAEGMDKESFSPALKCLRINGLRLVNVEKNIHVPKYAFTRLQLLSLPRAYRPPTSTCSYHTQS